MSDHNKTYKDPKRKVGSQKETPIIKYEGDNIIVTGYQSFIINKKTRNIKYIKKKNKFNYIDKLMKKLNSEHNCISIVDIGCNSGLTSLIAFNNNFEYIFSLDHDTEYIDTLKTIKNNCNIKKINEIVYSFGDELNTKFDVVFCGALIHWIFSLTASFGNFISIIKYLISITNKFLIIEWVPPTDGAIKSFNHIKKLDKNIDEEYNTHNFEIAIKKFTNIISKETCDSTRTIYFLKKIL
jgi:SAM-dependent methyltransferase